MSSPAKDTHIVQITVFTPNEGQLDAFVNRQLEGLPKFGDIPGSLGSKLYRSLDSRTVVMISRFESAADQARFSATDAFGAHRATILPLLETVSGGQYELIYERAPSGVPA
jgi:heme-degrading monooxygenase HmoA